MKKVNIPVLLSTVGALGVIATGALTAFATVKAVKVLEEKENKRVKDISINKDNLKQTVKDVGKYYILPAGAAVMSMGCIFVSNGLNRKLLVTLAGGLMTMSESFKHYRERMMDEAPEADEKVVAEMSESNDIYITPDGHNFGEVVKFYDRVSDRIFETTWVELGDAFYHLNRNFILRGYAYVNELYNFLGLDLTDEGDIYGWDEYWFWEGGLAPWIDYSTRFENGVYTIGFDWPEQDIHEEHPVTIREPAYFVSPR